MSEYVRRAGGGFGNRSGRAWSPHYQSDRQHEDSTALAHDTAGASDPVVPPSQRAMRRAIDADMCPFCPRGPFTNLGLHTNKAHGVSAGELRKLADLPRICSDELSDGSRDRLLARPDRDEITRRGTEEANKKGAHLVATEAFRKKRLEDARERDEETCRRAAAGDLLVDIASDFGVSVNAVRASLERHGVAQNQAKLRAKRHARLRQNGERAKAASMAALDAEKDRRLARFAELGADWQALCTLADELDVSRKAMRAYLVTHGVEIDGRASAVQPKRPNKVKPKSPCSGQGCTRDALCRGMCSMHYQRWRKSGVTD